MQLEVGMRVRQRGKYKPMVVIKFTGGEAECVWYQSNNLCRGYFQLTELVIISDGYEYLSFT